MLVVGDAWLQYNQIRYEDEKHVAELKLEEISLF